MLLKSRSNLEVIDAAIEIYKRNFPLVISVYLLAMIPMALSEGFLQGSFFGKLIGIILLIVGAVMYFFAPTIVALVTSDTYLGAPKRELSQLYPIVYEKKWDIIKASLVKTIFMSIGFMLLIIPGLIVLKRYFAIPALVVLENLPSAAARRRSSELSEGHGLRILLLYAIVGFAMLLVFGLMMALIALSATSGMLFFISLIQGIVTALVYPIFDIIITVLYYDIRIKKEGFDLQVAAETLPQ